MRGAIFVLSFAAMCGSAPASSLLVLSGEPASTPSIVKLGEPEAGISGDRVAAIPKTFGPQSPMVIRGGTVGGLSAAPAATPGPQTPSTPTGGALPEQASAPAGMPSAAAARQGSPAAAAAPAAPDSASVPEPL